MFTMGSSFEQIEDIERDTLTMEVELPKNESGDDLVPRLLVFEGATAIRFSRGLFRAAQRFWTCRLWESRNDGGGCASSPTPVIERCFARESESLSVNTSANFSVERIAADGAYLPVRPLGGRRHRSLHLATGAARVSAGVKPFKPWTISTDQSR